jgi:hypothetical protein
MDKPSNTIFDARNDSNRMNVDSFVNGVLSHQVEDLPDVQVATFKETLKVLMNTHDQDPIDTDTFEGWLFLLIQRIEEEPEGGRRPDRDNILAKLRRMSSGATSGPQLQAPGP